MSKVQMVRVLVNQRLTAAVEEIFGLFERTIAEYEEELCRSKEKNELQQKLLDAVLKPEVRLHRADVQQLVVAKVALENNEVECDAVKTSVGASECATSSDHKGKMQQRKRTQTEWSPSLDQEDPPEPPHIKEEQEELWTSQEGEQLQGLEEADITKFLFTPVPVKSEDDEEKPQSSQLQQRQTEQMETGADGEDCGGPEPARNSHPDPEANIEYEIEDSHPDPELGPVTEDNAEAKEPQSGLQSLKINVFKSDVRGNTENKPFSCSDCGRRFHLESNLKRHVKTHTSKKAFCCSICGKSFTVTNRLKVHMRIHTGYKPFSCSVCGRTFNHKGNLKLHLAIHKAERPFGCSVCGNGFRQKGNLRRHMVVHTQEKKFHCIVCDRRFAWDVQLKRHKCVCPQSTQLHQNQTEQS